MPVPHFNIKITQRSKGNSAVAGAAYQAGEKLFSEYDQKTKNYTCKKEVVYTEIMLPPNAPPEYADRATLWNSVEEIEKQWNSQLARRFVAALPREVPMELLPQMVKEYCEEQFVSKGMCCDFAIHDPDPPGHNPHCHFMLTMRAIDENGKWMPKSRKVYDLDENGERIKLPSGRWKSHKEDTVDWNEQYHAEEWRHGWEIVQNKYLELAGSPERIDMRSYERQGLDIIPTVHMGTAVSALERKGIATNIGNLNRDIKAANRMMNAIRSTIKSLRDWIHNADTEAKKAALFSKVRSGDVRVLLGSTAKMGAGTNVQQRLVAVHHLDVGWKPSDMTQRNGRIIRQGNMNKEVNVFNYVTEGTFDSYLFQTLENKQRFISQIMTSKSPVRSCDDVDEQALSYAEIKALCVGNPLIKEKMDLDVQVAKLKVLKADHQSQKFRLEDKLLTKFPAEIQEQTAKIAALKSDAEIAAAHPQDKENFCGMVIKGMTYDEKKTAGERLILACMELPNTEEQVVGSYRGFELSLRFDTFHNEHQALLKGTLKYPVPLGSDPHGNIVRLDNALSNFADRSTAAENELDTLRQQQAAAQVEVAKPFPQEEELAQKSARLAELNAQLDVDEKHHEPEQDEEEKEDAPRRSVLAVLEEKAEKAEPVKPFKSYLDKDGDAR